MDPIQNQSADGSAPPVAPTETSAPKSAVHDTTLMGVLAYIGPLVLIPFFVAKEVPFVKFHVKQGLVVFVLEVVLWFIGDMLYGLDFLIPIVTLVNIGLLILSILGIVNVIQKKEAVLPLVGKYSEYFKF